MNFIAKIKLIKLPRHSFFYSTSTVEHKDPDNKVNALKPKEIRPFSKDMLLSRFNLDLLEFPQIDNNEGVDKVTIVSKEIEKMFQTKALDRDTMLTKLSGTGIMGVSTPGLVDSGQYSWMMVARLIESLSIDMDYTLINYLPQVLVCQAVQHGGNETQLMEYQMRLARAELKGCVAISEGLSTDSDWVSEDSITTMATPDEATQSWILNGSKTRVFNYSGSDIVVVFARTLTGDIAPFIVNTNSPGLTVNGTVTTQNKRCSNLILNNVAVPKQNILSSQLGVQLPRYLTSIHNMSIAAACSSLIKSLIRQVNQFICSRHIFGRPLSQFEIVQAHLVSITADAYATETVAYFSAGLLDDLEHNDLLIESTLAKIHGIEALKRSVDTSMKIIGINCLSDPQFTKTYNDINTLVESQVSSTRSRLHSTKESIDYFVQQMKTSKFNPWEKICKFIGNYKIDGHMRGGYIANSFKYNLHPRIGLLADNIYSDLSKLPKLLSKMSHSGDGLTEDLYLTTVSGVLVDSFVLMAVMGRSSRSLCIGLRNCDQEVQLTEYISKSVTRNIHEHVTMLDNYEACISGWNARVSALNNDGLGLTEWKNHG